MRLTTVDRIKFGRHQIKESDLVESYEGFKLGEIKNFSCEEMLESRENVKRVSKPDH